jgi:Ser/Thr protein kinase RdoA (MazF antagonist)
MMVAGILERERPMWFSVLRWSNSLYRFPMIEIPLFGSIRKPGRKASRRVRASAGTSAASDAELRSVLERALDEAGIGPPREIHRRPSEYRTSFPLEELDLTLEDGTELRLVFKQLAWAALDEEARLAKPEFLHDPRREAAVYASVLAPAALGAPRYYGSAIDPEAERYWLFIERVEGRELHQVGDLELWQAAASWLGAMHLSLGADLERHAGRGRLIDYDQAYYRRWIERARQFAAAPGQPESRSEALDWIAARYEPVIEGLLDLPKTVIHGEFYASNVLVGGGAPTPRICPVDWELAATAPGLVDLAALVSGDWGEDDREAIVSAYRSAVGPAAFSARQLGLARLHVAVQWLGWAPPSWVPPEGQRHDWLAEAVQLAEELGL